MSQFLIPSKIVPFRKQAWMKKALGLSFMFFFLKGMVWLVVISAAVVGIVD